MIENHPELLPVDAIEPVFAPLISIGRELSTNVGPIDNLFISPQGYLTVVETKLWMNPEARREVVGQIIDYAKEINKWTFDQLNSKVRDYLRKHKTINGDIVTLVKQTPEGSGTEEKTIIDNISRNLKLGRFLLLIAGDGIRESVEDMVAYLQQTPQLLFTLALVELQIYEFGKDDKKSLLISPQIVARTKEITRAIVRVEGKEIESVHVDVDIGPIQDKMNEERLIKESSQICTQLYYRLKEFSKQEVFKFSGFTEKGYALRYMEPKRNLIILFPDYLMAWIGKDHSDEFLDNETVRDFYSDLNGIDVFNRKKDRKMPEVVVNDKTWSVEDLDKFMKAVEKLGSHLKKLL